MCVCVQDADLDYECVLVIEGQTVVVDAYVETDDMNPSNFDITCQLHQVCTSVLTLYKTMCIKSSGPLQTNQFIWF